MPTTTVRERRETIPPIPFGELAGVDLADCAAVRRLIPKAGQAWRTVPPVNAYELQQRCEWLGKRSIKTHSKLFALRLAIRMCDLTTREGADEIDMVISRGAFLQGDYRRVYDEIAKVKDACGARVHLKVILETGELGDYDAIRRASHIALMAGADFIKTSTGKVQPAATLPATLVMLEAIRDFYDATGRAVGMKPAGGIRTAKDAIRYLLLLHEALGADWLTPDRFRFGASSLLNDLLRQLVKQMSGSYRADDEFAYD